MTVPVRISCCIPPFIWRDRGLRYDGANNVIPLLLFESKSEVPIKLPLAEGPAAIVAARNCCWVCKICGATIPRGWPQMEEKSNLEPSDRATGRGESSKQPTPVLKNNQILSRPRRSKTTLLK